MFVSKRSLLLALLACPLVLSDSSTTSALRGDRRFLVRSSGWVLPRYAHVVVVAALFWLGLITCAYVSTVLPQMVGTR